MAIKLPNALPGGPVNPQVDIPGIANPYASPILPQAKIKPTTAIPGAPSTKIGKIAKPKVKAAPGPLAVPAEQTVPVTPDSAKMQEIIKSTNVQNIMKMDDNSWKKLLAKFGVGG